VNELCTKELPSWDHADSKYVPYVWVDSKGVKFIGNKHIDPQLLVHIFTGL